MTLHQSYVLVVSKEEYLGMIYWGIWLCLKYASHTYTFQLLRSLQQTLVAD